MPLFDTDIISPAAGIPSMFSSYWVRLTGESGKRHSTITRSVMAPEYCDLFVAGVQELLTICGHREKKNILSSWCQILVYSVNKCYQMNVHTIKSITQIRTTIYRNSRVPCLKPLINVTWWSTFFLILAFILRCHFK